MSASNSAANKIKLVKIKPQDLVVGKTSPWPVSDAHGTELVQAGELIESSSFKELLDQIGYFVQPASVDKAAVKVATQKSESSKKSSTAPVYKDASSRMQKLKQPVKFRGRVNPFAEFDDLSVQLESMFRELEAGKAQAAGKVERFFYNLAANIQGLIEYDADALMGAVHLSERFEYAVHHPMQIAILTELILERLQVPQAIRLSTLAAALTSNLAMNPYQNQLDNQKTPLTDAQRKMINNHPLLSARQLNMFGVEDELWLQLVEQHHEKLDGTGYPRQLTKKDIRSEALVLALADVYSAMITPRKYRGPIRINESLRDLFIQRGSSFDDRLTRIFINELGLYPPGVYVRLENGELAVVVGRSDDFKSPWVACIKKPDGNMHSSPRKHSSAKPGYKIKHVCDPSERVRVDASQLWGFEALKIDIKVDLSSVDSFILGLR